MDNHPIPQDVTGFQFRLIGAMTVKQFAYVGVGAILAVIVFYFPFPILLKLLLVPLFGGTGALFAFVPLEGRPMDVMAANFFKALFTPNQYLYHKKGGVLSFTLVTAKMQTPSPANHATTGSENPTNKEQKLASYLNQLQPGSQNTIDQKESAYLQKLFTTQALISPTVSGTITQNTSPSVLAPLPAASSNNSGSTPLPTQLPSITPPVPMQQLTPTPQVSRATNPAPTPPEVMVQPQPQPQPQPQVPSSEPTKQQEDQPMTDPRLEAILAEKKRLEEELAQLRQNQGLGQNQPFQQVQTQQPTSQQPKMSPPSTVVKTVELKAGTLPDIPNLLMGTIRDSRGNLLSNILVEVRDTDGNPVRAFKTNLVGQFASATALLNGSYTVSFEDPKAQHTFSDVAITADGSVIQPLDIISIDAREELRKALFA